MIAFAPECRKSSTRRRPNLRTLGERREERKEHGGLGGTAGMQSRWQCKRGITVLKV